MKTRDVIRLLNEDGWQLARVNGSHHVFKHAVKKGRIVVPVHGMNRDLPVGTAHDILKKAELK